MSILNQLSSQVGDDTEDSNRKLVTQCLEDPELLSEIVEGLKHKDAALVGDCAEVLTKVAEENPKLVVPYAENFSALLSQKNTRIRWEAMHALALIASLTPTTIAALLPKLAEILHTDASVIVRDYATDAIANYASTGKSAAQAAYPLLKEMLTLWGGKQARHALHGLVHVARFVPTKRAVLLPIAEDYSHSEREVVRKAAKELIKVIDSQSKRNG